MRLYNKKALCLKQAVQIRLDADVLACYKMYRKGYQSWRNAELREVMLRSGKEWILLPVKSGLRVAFC